MTVDALRQLLDQIDLEGGPELARCTRPLSADPRDRSMTAAPTPASIPTRLAKAAETMPVGQLLTWGDAHADSDVQDAAARTRAALLGLRARYATDHELAQLDSEQADLEKRLADLRARQAELMPTKRKRSAPVRDYEAHEVRAWAEANGVECAPVGQIPKRVLDAWRTAVRDAPA